MDSVFADCGGFDRIDIPCAILDATMVAGNAGEPILDLYRDDQLWDIFASKTSVGCCENVPPRPISVSGAADYDSSHVRDGNNFLEPSREAVLET